MKKQKVQIVSAVVAAAFLSQTAAFALDFGNGYPEHKGTMSYVEQENSTKDCWTDTKEDHLFTVGGKQFILLDTDGAGNYFVMAEGHYGKRAFDTSYARQPVIADRTVDENNVETYTPGPAHNIDDEQWRYDPEHEKNIGYWLNHDFFNFGNGGTNVLPEAIKDNLAEKEWEVENYKPVISHSVNNLTNIPSLKAKSEEFITPRFKPKYSVEGKISLMSYTEYKKYQDIIGFKFCDLGWNGFMLRTPYSLITTDANGTKLVYKFGGMQVRNRSDKPTPNKMIIVGNDSPNESFFYVKPVMWLKSNFFKEVKCELEGLGKIAKTEVLKNSEAELKTLGYSDMDISRLIGKPRSWNWGNYPTHSDEAKLLARLSVKTGTVKGPSNPDNLFTIGGRRFILLDRNLNGEYFVMADEEYGQRSLYTTNHLNSIPTDKKEWLPVHWLFNPQVTDSVAYMMNSTQWGILSNDIIRAFKYDGGYNGDTTPKLIPQSMVDDLVETDWEVEPCYPEYSWKVDGIPYPQYAENDTVTQKAIDEILAWQSNLLNNTSKTTVRAKLTHMSFTEYQTYKDKIGFVYYPTTATYAGTLLRTPYAVVDGGDKVGGEKTDSWSVAPGFMTVKITGENNEFSNANATDNKYMFRPVMWLKSDFFKNNKIDVATAGKTIFNEMRDLYTAEDLAAQYTPAEIYAMGIDVDFLTDLSYTSEGGAVESLSEISEITVSANVVNVGVSEETVVVALYKEGKLVGVNFQVIAFDNEPSLPAEVTVDGFDGADTCAVMLWKGLSGGNALAPVYKTTF